jgi:hypothetical protein
MCYPPLPALLRNPERNGINGHLSRAGAASLAVQEAPWPSAHFSSPG